MIGHTCVHDLTSQSDFSSCVRWSTRLRLRVISREAVREMHTSRLWTSRPLSRAPWACSTKSESSFIFALLDSVCSSLRYWREIHRPDIGWEMEVRCTSKLRQAPASGASYGKAGAIDQAPKS